MSQTTAYRSLYRVYRPQCFAEVVNQRYPVQTLQHAIIRGEIAHAYLFAGSRGTGKTSVARIFAKAINCPQQQEGEPCNNCDVCRRITRGGSLDVIEIDGASNRGIDQIRQLRAEVNFVPAEVRYKVYIIDEVHMLTHEAFNALLKTLEEPPTRVLFILATTEPHKLPPTVISRCLTFEFKNIASPLIARRLEQVCEREQITAKPETLAAIARRARGAMRDALVLLEQLVAYAGERPIELSDLTELLGLPGQESVEGFLDALQRCDSARLLEIIADLAERGKDLALFVEELIQQGRDRLIAALNQKNSGEEAADWVRLSGALLELERELGRAWDRRILLEVKALELCQAAQTPTPQPKVKRSKAKPLVQAGAKGERATPVAAGVVAGPEPVASAGKPETPRANSDPWSALLELAKRERVALYALLAEAQPRREGRKLQIEFEPEYQFHKEQLAKAENLEALAALARRVYGEVVEVGVSFRAASKATASRSSSSAEAPGQELQDKAELIRQTLGGELVD
ncbi:MAG TPA: DNA polymerase III subunit gamma/tau [Candidatus Fraserbacteria bacterium]|nr:DNA polymerase III subunit gamma/tau [Candidatus Fraserbacteria bacterium]